VHADWTPLSARRFVAYNWSPTGGHAPLGPFHDEIIEGTFPPVPMGGSGIGRYFRAVQDSNIDASGVQINALVEGSVVGFTNQTFQMHSWLEVSFRLDEPTLVQSTVVESVSFPLGSGWITPAGSPGTQIALPVELQAGNYTLYLQDFIAITTTVNPNPPRLTTVTQSGAVRFIRGPAPMALAAVAPGWSARRRRM
jgi:hypothetical protein